MPTSVTLRKQWRIVNSSGVHVYPTPSEQIEGDPLFSKDSGDIVTEYDRRGDWIQIHPNISNGDAFQEEQKSGDTSQTDMVEETEI